MLIKHMAQGFSFDSFAAEIDVCDDTLYEWAKVHPAFSDAKKIATQKSRKFWESAGIEGLFSHPKGPVLNTGAWIFNMRNRFGWRNDPVAKPGDKQDQAIVKLGEKLAEEIETEEEF